ncbi:hypothetical protein [Pseudoxanthomonas sacheonensis]|uniref:hypothetical protein n=1 Tax=Pseudoxanthomonas sacheonensis TaxID=443615 RepID=UPI0013D71EAD|nr:hypothetical protein [Pseudoxanthomonas sacheonensis]KAF1705904.1 hypothetical protein CSC73_17940 [Pseudoxanthomonas sacheonensis]
MRGIIQVILALALCAVASSALARFVSVDPVQANPNTGTNFNRYYYGNNNPYRFTDPDGRCPEESTRSTCIPASNFDSNRSSGVNVQLSPASTDTAKNGKSTVIVTSGDREKLGTINNDSSTGSESVQLVSDTRTSTTNTAYKAEGTKPGNAVAVIHGHPTNSLNDDRATLGDAQAVVDHGIPNIAVANDGRMVVHEVENGQYQVRMINGRFTNSEIRHFQRETNERQESFYEP